jgi:hypothetical protein
MSNQKIAISTYIFKSSHSNYFENKNMKLVLKDKIGEGAYGIVYNIETISNEEHVIKIFKRPTMDNLILKESRNLIPLETENREILFYYKYINSKKYENNYIISAYAIGILKSSLKTPSMIIHKNNYFIILPKCIPFYEIFGIYNKPLINEKNGFIFTLTIMNRLLKASNYLEKTYDLTNLDLKLNNFMFPLKSNNLNDIVMLDFSIIKKKSKNKGDNIYYTDKKYYIWPLSPIVLDYIPSYSICINGIELLFGNNKIRNICEGDDKKMLNTINGFLNIIKKHDNYKNKPVYNIFYNGLIIKITTMDLIILINNFLK